MASESQKRDTGFFATLRMTRVVAAPYRWTNCSKLTETCSRPGGRVTGGSVPLLCLRVAVCLLVATSAWAQSAVPQVGLAFEVASIRPSKPGSPQHSNVPLDSGNVYGTINAEDDARTATGGYLRATHQPLWRYISFAYKLSGTQELALRFSMFSGAPKSGAPFWVTGSFNAAPEYFDIVARAPAETSVDQMRLMMQMLLADRFHLAAHMLPADAPVFGLVLAKPHVTGPLLRPHPVSDSCAAAKMGEQDSGSTQRPASSLGDLPPICGVVAHVASVSPGQHYGGRAVALSLLASSLPTMTGLAVLPRPVVDQTDLEGQYDFTLSWVHDATPDDGVVADNVGNFKDALKKQLGLELKSSHATIDFLILDHVERPTEN